MLPRKRKLVQWCYHCIDVLVNLVCTCVAEHIVIPSIGNDLACDVSNPICASLFHTFLVQCRFGAKMEFAHTMLNRSKDSYDHRQSNTFQELVSFAMQYRPCDVVTFGLKQRVRLFGQFYLF